MKIECSDLFHKVSLKASKNYCDDLLDEAILKDMRSQQVAIWCMNMKLVTHDYLTSSIVSRHN